MIHHPSNYALDWTPVQVARASRQLLSRDFAVVTETAPASGVIVAQPRATHCLSLYVGPPARIETIAAGRPWRRLQRPGDMEIVPASLDALWHFSDPASVISLRIWPRLFRGAAESLDIDPDRVDVTPHFQLTDPQIEPIMWAFKAAFEAAFDDGEPPESLYLEGLGVALAAHVLRRYGVKAPARRPGLSKRRLGRVIDYIDAHLDTALGLAELAGIAGLGASQFKTLFKQSMRLPVHQYVVRRRVERARQLLLAGNRSIADVALDVGFAHQSHLAQWMRRLLGVTPATLLSQSAAAQPQRDRPILLPTGQI